MKLRNKRTGQEGNFIINVDHFECVDVDNVPEYRALAELNKEWEDAPEELKECWTIDTINMKAAKIYEDSKYRIYSDENLNCLDALGLKFETKEEAEKAIEKLKAWKRLKDKGFSFLGVHDTSYAIDFGVNPPYTHITFDEYTATEEQKEFYNDLMLLFGGDIKARKEE